MGRTRQAIRELTARQREVLALVAKGHTNAEIAELLGITLAGAKWHVSELLTRLDVDSREELAEYWASETGIRRRLGRFAAALAGLVPLKAAAVVVGGLAMLSGVGVAVAVIVSSGGTNGGNAATSVAAAVGENPDGWFDAGQVFFVSGTTQPVEQSAVRALNTTVTMAGPGIIKLSSGKVQWLKTQPGPGGEALLGGIVDGETQMIAVQGGDNTSILIDSADSVRFFGINGVTRPELILSNTPLHASSPQLLNAGSDGRLFLDLAPTPDNAVINSDTGEVLDTSRATLIGPEHEGGNTSCGGDLAHDNGGQCIAYWVRDNPMVAPTDGALTCTPSGSWQLTTPNFVLFFAGTHDPSQLAIGIGPQAPCTLPAASVTVRRGIDQIGDSATSFVITATTNDPNRRADQQSPLSVAFGGGSMYVGLIHLKVGCPCLGDSATVQPRP